MSESITGRDGYIIAKALVWALDHAKTRPDDEREWSDEADMQKLLDEKFSFAADVVAQEQSFAAAIERAHQRAKADDIDLEIALQEELWNAGFRFAGNPKRHRRVDHEKNRRDLAETIRQTKEAFGLPK